MSKIEWTEKTWNPVTGCTKVSAGCKHCYAETMTKRLQAMDVEKYSEGFGKVRMHLDQINTPLHWKKPKMVFVNSMSDLYHEDIAPWFVQEIYHTMAKAYWHQFQVLTKRPERIHYNCYRLYDKIKDEWVKIQPLENVWVGTSIESERVLSRLEELKKANGYKFLSLEPLLGPLPNLDLSGIDWVIVGGESGPKARPMHPEWVREIRYQCHEQNVPFFFKQWGGRNKKAAGRTLDGQTWDEYPEQLLENLANPKRNAIDKPLNELSELI
jgi:protein gp37